MATLNTSNGAQSNKPKYLVLLDMKGTICYRTDESVGRARHDLFIRRKFYYKRLGVNEFVLQLHATGMFDICVYSSMMAHNIEAGLNAIMPHRRLLRAVLDREMNKPDPAGINEWDTVRDMKKVWNRLPGYGPERTLLLDNEARKFQDAPENGIVVPEFGPAEVLSKKSGTLDTLLQYLLDLARDAPKDVREYLGRIHLTTMLYFSLKKHLQKHWTPRRRWTACWTTLLLCPWEHPHLPKAPLKPPEHLAV